MKKEEIDFVYILESHSGSYEDYIKSIEGVFLDKDVVINTGLELWDKQNNWRNKLTIPDDVYYQYCDSFDIDEETCNIIYKDCYGFTKEQWEQDGNVRIEHEYNVEIDYTVTKYALNLLIYEQSNKTLKEVVWSTYNLL